MQSKASLIYIKKQLNLFSSTTSPHPHLESNASFVRALRDQSLEVSENLHFHIDSKWSWKPFECFKRLFFSRISVGRPQPQVRWLINGLQVDDQYEHNSGDVIENRLLWPSIQRSDLNSIFTCQALNTKLVEPKETSFVLDMNCEFRYDSNCFSVPFFVLLSLSFCGGWDCRALGGNFMDKICLDLLTWNEPTYSRSLLI